MWQISAVLGIALMTTGGAVKVYYDKAQAEKETMALEIKQAAQNQVILENSIKSLNDQVLQAEEDKKRAFEQINVLQKANEEARAEVSNLKNKFAKHDMNVLSLRKPKLIENIINKESTILENKQGEPYMENSCCTEIKNVRNFLFKQDKSIYEKNSLITNYFFNIISTLFVIIQVTCILPKIPLIYWRIFISYKFYRFTHY